MSALVLGVSLVVLAGFALLATLVAPRLVRSIAVRVLGDNPSQTWRASTVLIEAPKTSPPRRV